METAGFMQAVQVELENRVHTGSLRLMLRNLLIFFQKLFQEHILNHEKDNLEVTCNNLAVLDIFIHYTALAGAVGEGLVFHMIGDRTGKYKHDFIAAVLVQRSVYQICIAGKGQLGRKGLLFCNLVHGDEIPFFMAGFQQYHERRVQLIQLQGAAVGIKYDKIIRGLTEQLFQGFFP